MGIKTSISSCIYHCSEKCCQTQTAGNINSKGKYFGWIFIRCLLENSKKMLLLICYLLIKLLQLRFYLSVMLENSKKDTKPVLICLLKSHQFRKSQKVQVFLPCSKEASSHGRSEMGLRKT